MDETEKNQLLENITVHMLALEKDIPADHAAQLTYQRCLVHLLQYPAKEAQVPKWERDYIRSLAKYYTIGDLAYIFGRGKATIHAILSTVSH